MKALIQCRRPLFTCLKVNRRPKIKLLQGVNENEIVEMEAKNEQKNLRVSHQKSMVFSHIDLYYRHESL